MALRHPRTLILSPIESAYATSYWLSIILINSNLGRILPRFRDIAARFPARERQHRTRILGVFPLDKIDDVVAPRREDPKLIILVINFELV